MSTKMLDATIKSVADNGVWEAVASTPTLDRDQEIVAAGALWWSAPTVPVHDEHFGTLVGTAVPRYVGHELRIVGRFASTPRAQETRTLVNEGHLSTMSVMFLPSASEPGRGNVKRIITKGELLAVDFAPVASNRDARVLASRSVSGSATSLIAEARHVVAMGERYLRSTHGPIRSAVDEGLRIIDSRSYVANLRRMTGHELLDEARRLVRQ